eukprot:416148_1
MGSCASTKHMQEYKPQYTSHHLSLTAFESSIMRYIKKMCNDIDIHIPIGIKLLCIKYCKYSDLIINERTTLQLVSKSNNFTYIYNSLTIKNSGILTVNNNNSTQIGAGQGGKLNIICFGNIILEQNASINLNGCGHLGTTDIAGG